MMKRLFFFLFSLVCTTALWAQTKQTVAVYTTDATNLNVATFVGDYVVDVIVKQGRYIAVERSSHFRSQLASEQQFQRSGAVDDSQIAALGKNSGAAFVCVVKVEIAMNKPYVTARLVNTETSGLAHTGRPEFFDSQDINSLQSACRKMVGSMFGTSSSSPTYGSTSSSGVTTGQGYTERAWGIDMKFVWVEGGSFLMGCTAEQGGECDADEKNVRRVNLNGYYIGQFEVTQAQWEKVMGTSVYQQRNKRDSSASVYGVGGEYPIYYVSWEEAMEFCRLLSQQTGKRYSLPTEAQWEYAARGGNRNEGTKYSGSHMVDGVAWYTGNSGGTTHPVGTRRPNVLGIYDMSGNVWEWCRDWYSADYANYSTNNPQGPSSGSYRGLRGGSWGINAASCRVSYRNSDSPTDRSNFLGFRLVMEP